MKQLSRMLGVTLLEIMLVLAIAAMVIVMSIKYYQSATQSQQANAMMERILAITAAADNLSQGTGTYSGVVTSANIAAIVGANNLATPWNSVYSYSGASTTSYTVQITNIPVPICVNVTTKLGSGAAGSHYTGASCGATTGTALTTLSFTYNTRPN